MEKYCQNDLCENEAAGQVPIVLAGPCDQKRALCAVCKKAYDWGVQDGRMMSPRKKVWVLAIADRGVVVHGRAFRRRRKAVQGLAEYLKTNEGYRGSDDMPSISDWLAEHDERLGVDIFPASLDAG
jgi:hypothetical protein